MSRVRALLIASAIACGLVGAVAAPAHAEVATGAVLAGPDTADAATGARLPGPTRVVEALRDPEVSDATLVGVSPVALLAALPELEVEELRRLGDGSPDTLAELVRRPPSVTSVSSWWSGLDAGRRAVLSTGLPELVGNLEGVPYAVRDAANRRALAARIDALEAAVTRQPGRGAQRISGRDLQMLDRIRDALRPAEDGPARTLLTLDTTYPGRAGIVLGDLGTAAYVDIVVPGMYISIDNRMIDWTDIAQSLHDQQTSVLARLGGASAGAGVATVAWIGYQTPDLMDVGTLDLARAGADYLEDAIQGIQGLRRDDPPYVAVLAHSYGSSAALLALSSGRASVDALALVGSPGGAVRDVSELQVPADRVFVGEAAWDPVPVSAFFGTDPGSPGFGARLFGVSGASDDLTGEALSAAVGHNGYFEPGTESLRNLALIGIDRSSWLLDPAGVSEAGGDGDGSRGASWRLSAEGTPER